MDTADLMEAIAIRVATIAGIAGASYPQLNYVPESPWAMIRQSRTIPSVYEQARMGQEVALPAIDVVLLITSSETRPADAARIDRLATAVRDAFNPAATGGNVNTVLVGLDGHVDRVWYAINDQRTPLTWGESGYCEAAIITMDSKFRRKVGP